MRTFALAALAAFTSAQSLDDLPFDPTDEDFLESLGITVDTSKCEYIADPSDSAAVRACFDEVEGALKGIDYEGLIDDQWAEFKQTADYDSAKEVWDALPFYSSAQADADVAEIADLIDAEIKSS